MKLHTKNSIALFLAAVCLGSTACGAAAETPADTGTPAPDGTNVAAETETQAPAEPLFYGLELKDFGGKEFRICTSDTYLDEMIVDGENGDICNDAVYYRNRAVEEAYNIKISAFVPGDPYEESSYVAKTVTAGEDAFDLSAVFTFLAGGPILNGCFLNWNDIPHVDFNREWWIQSANEAFSVGGSRYVAVGDLSITTLLLSYVVFFNRKIAADYDIPDLYQTVLDGKWTIDYMSSLTKDIYTDLNGSGKPDKEDFFGFVGDSVTNLDAWTSAFDIPLIGFDGGNPKVVMDLDKFSSGIDKVLQLYYGGQPTYISGGDGTEIGVFAAGRAAFMTSWIKQAFDEFRSMTDDYGILPYPKFDEAQQNYYTNSMDNYSLLSVPKTESDPEFVGLITEALTRESHRIVFPAYYDVALTEKYARDEQSVTMLDMIMAGRLYDFSILHNSSIADFPYMFRNMIRTKKNTTASKYEKISQKIESGLASLAEQYAELASLEK
ncbi:MAG: hypothetical protein MJ175_02030 [Clostridia bacterium]|nr:hypothetical protein [Clostridia bacterium]